MLQIRTRQINERPLEKLTEPQKSTIRFFNTFGMSLLVIAFGLVRYKLKQRGRQRYEEGFSAEEG